jgi:GNAT superfamily N-acetyltransferase
MGAAAGDAMRSAARATMGSAAGSAMWGATAGTVIMIGLGQGRTREKRGNSNGNQYQTHISFPENGGMITGTKSISSFDATSKAQSMAALSIRAAVQSDASAIVALLGELAAYEELLGTFGLTEEIVRRDMLGTACHSALALLDGEPAGVATWYWTYKSFAPRRGLFIEDLYVRPAFRGHGVGKALLAHLAGRACEAGGLVEWQVLDWNKPSIDFYDGLGARPLTQWLNYRLEGESLERLKP